MKIIETQAQADALAVDGILRYDSDIVFECSVICDFSIIAQDITARNITARNITARNITARNITARNITARNINARNINALDITAQDIIFFAICIAYVSLTCKSVSGRLKNALARCLAGEIVYNSGEEK